ncbi:VAN3-binding protein isoform X2 [Dendrobium catenatum]|uniref:VAN3-binding protein isoform X2 n=1 Tax=Dendrobium catenatum TaxID=906689 RepID=UPI00109F39ED|nr:VAN3-binding protein isoform X2 [Dendrobium catenatum]
MDNARQVRPLRSTSATATPPPELILGSMEFLSRSWSPTAFEIAKALSPRLPPRCAASAAILDHTADEAKDFSAPLPAGNHFTFACSATSQLVMERIMSQPLTSGRLSHSSGPLNGGSLSDSPPFSPCDWEDVQDLPFLAQNFHKKNHRTTKPPKPNYRVESRTLSKWLKDRRERKDEARAQNAQLDAAISVASLAAAVSAIAAATAGATSTEDDCASRTNDAIASAATLVAAQCVEAAEALGAERGHLAAAVASAISVRTTGDIVALTTSAAAALRGAEPLKARVFKEIWNIAAVIPEEKGFSAHRSRQSSEEARDSSGEVMPEEHFQGLCSQEVLARGAELLKRSRTGALHWKIVSVYIDRDGHVKLKTKSRHVAGSITSKKKNIIEVWKDMPPWPGRHLLQEGGAERRYFGLKTIEEGVVEFECRGQREYEIWTKGVSWLLSIAGEKARGAQ